MHLRGPLHAHIDDRPPDKIACLHLRVSRSDTKNKNLIRPSVRPRHLAGTRSPLRRRVSDLLVPGCALHQAGRLPLDGAWFLTPLPSLPRTASFSFPSHPFSLFPLYPTLIWLVRGGALFVLFSSPLFSLRRFCSASRKRRGGVGGEIRHQSGCWYYRYYFSTLVPLPTRLLVQFGL